MVFDFRHRKISGFDAGSGGFGGDWSSWCLSIELRSNVPDLPRRTSTEMLWAALFLPEWTADGPGGFGSRSLGDLDNDRFGVFAVGRGSLG